MISREQIDEILQGPIPIDPLIPNHDETLGLTNQMTAGTYRKKEKRRHRQRHRTCAGGLAFVLGPRVAERLIWGGMEWRGGGRDGCELLRTRTMLSGEGSASTERVHRGEHERRSGSGYQTVTNKPCVCVFFFLFLPCEPRKCFYW